MSSLYLVATPIGNLADISLRALKVLQEVPLIAAEDTRTSRVLLEHYQIKTPLTSYHDHNKALKTQTLLEHLQESDLALISDAGTPGINDPGYLLVRAALEAGHQVVPVPGASAPVAALSASGLASDQFLYLGYLPRKRQARRLFLEQVQDYPWTLIVLETPHRLIQALEDIGTIMPDRDLAAARELTKLHEEIVRGKARQLRDHFLAAEVRGEFTLVIAGKPPGERWSHQELLTEIRDRQLTGSDSPSQLARNLAQLSGWSRREIYDLMQGLDEDH